MGAFGDKFRTERERRGFTLDDVSNVTKISSRMLKAIEEEHFDLLPGGVFNKGFVRAYAKHLGFNDQELVSEYLSALRQAQIQAQTAAWEPSPPPPLPATPIRINSPQPAQAPAGQIRIEQLRTGQSRAEQRRPEPLPADKVRPNPKPSPLAISPSPNKTSPAQVSGNVNLETKREVAQKTPPAKAPEATTEQVVTATQQNPPPASHSGGSAPRRDSLPWKVPAVVVATLIIAAVMWNRHSRVGQAGATTSLRPADSQSATLPPTPQTTAAPVNTPTRDLAASSTPGANSEPQPTPRKRANSESAAATSTAAVSHPRDGAPQLLASEHATTNQPIPDHSIANRKSTPAAKVPPPVFTLRVRASESTWISVIADGQPLSHETLIAPASTSFRASREITVKVGNAAAVSFLLNGKEIPPQGKEAEVRTITFNSKGMKESGPASTPDAPR